jgi:hypothetical protein
MLVAIVVPTAEIDADAGVYDCDLEVVAVSVDLRDVHADVGEPSISDTTSRTKKVLRTVSLQPSSVTKVAVHMGLSLKLPLDMQ